VTDIIPDNFEEMMNKDQPDVPFFYKSAVSRNFRRQSVTILVVLGLTWLLSSGCSFKKIAINSLADTLAESSAGTFASDEDPELVRDALPFGLKTIEALLMEAPDHSGLLLAACSGFTQYANAFLETDAFLIEEENPVQARRLRQRALKMYIRARDYGLRGLEVECPGITERLKKEPFEAAAAIEQEHISLLYWTAASWGSAISLDLSRPELVADVDAVRALVQRGFELEPAYGRGAIHEVMLVLEALPAMMGGSYERARFHFERAVAISDGKRASPYVLLAESVAMPRQDREEFVQLLGKALAVDPDEYPQERLANLISQKKARVLLERIEDLFL
jgi:predicted anti-sigma-YlaC factor YlaD